MTHHPATRWVLGAALVLGGGTGLADDPAPHPHGPPPESIQACSGIQEGATCSFTMGERAVTGTCRTGPGGEGALACAPPRPPGR